MKNIVVAAVAVATLGLLPNQAQACFIGPCPPFGLERATRKPDGYIVCFIGPCRPSDLGRS